MEAHYNLGLVASDQGRVPDVIKSFRKALKLRPEFGPAHVNLGNAFMRLDQVEDAAKSYKKAVKLEPSLALAHNNLGNALGMLGQNDEAITCFHTAIDLDPNYPDPQYNLGSALKDVGQFTEAEESFRQSLALKPGYAAAVKNLIPICDVAEDAELIATAETLRANPDVGWEDRMLLDLALGDVYEKQARFEDAASSFRAANILKREHTPYDLAVHADKCARIMETYAPDMSDRSGAAGCADNTPIFIVGMPRSGTTLVEQILASHPDVYGAGELTHLRSVVGDDVRAPDDPAAMGADYVSKLRHINKDAPRITDKMPDNFLRLGAIRLMLPEAGSSM